MYRYTSRPFRVSTFCFSAASWSANMSASHTIRSIMSSDRRPFSLVMVRLWVLPVPLSDAEMLRMPLASRSNDASI